MVAALNPAQQRHGIVEMAEGLTRTLRGLGQYPEVGEIVDCPSGGEVRIDGCPKANFSSNSFLGICDHPLIIEAQEKCLETSGAGAGSARLVVSHRIHRALEERIAAFKGRESAVVFSTGMLGNIGIIPALASSPLRLMASGLVDSDTMALFKPVSLFLDKFCHSCIYDGAALAEHNLWGGKPAKVHRYNHMDVSHLEDILSKAVTAEEKEGRESYRMVLTDGVFSIHGHLAPLPEIVNIAQRFNAAVYVDDAHGTGVLGKHGRGTAEELGVDDKIDIPYGTLSKALGGAGGYVVGSRDFCDYIRVAARTYVFQTAMPPSAAAGLIAAIDIVESEPWRRVRLLSNAARVRGELERLGFNTCGSRHHIIPVLIGDEMVTAHIGRELLGMGIYAGTIRYPAVPLGQGVIRCNMMATHTDEQLDQLVSALGKLGRKYGIIV